VKVSFRLDGRPVEVDVRPDENLLTVLRRDLGVLGVRESCGLGACGACAVLLDGEQVSACLLLAPLAEGAEVTTAEGLGGDHPVVHAFVEAHAYQCGWCTPGMVVAAAALLGERASPTDDEIRLGLAGNLCRCGCYLKIEEAVRRVAAG
jgi:aerobic-type carbon monoxide dehydrogenase small subunit (CoxS/CutS family)